MDCNTECELIVPTMTAKEAMRLCSKIRSQHADLAESIRKLRDGHGWVSLGYASWALCCQEEFGYTKQHVNRLIRAEEVKQQVEQNCSTPLPQMKDSHASELARLPAEHQPTAWGDFTEDCQSHGERPTAKTLRQFIDRRLRPKVPVEVSSRAGFTCAECGEHEQNRWGDCSACGGRRAVIPGISEPPVEPANVHRPTSRILTGDCREMLRTLDTGSVHCVVTSPPYYGLRDYGTGTWEGGEPDCEHKPKAEPRESRPASGLTGGKSTIDAGTILGQTCHCGARRIDSQIGLEQTVEEYIAELVKVFGEVWRVLHDSGTAFVNLGDSFFNAQNSNRNGAGGSLGGETRAGGEFKTQKRSAGTLPLKRKDLSGIPWRVAFALQAEGWYLRQDIIWHKPSPLPESATDRFTRSHEYVFMLTKRERYFFDQEAVKEPAKYPGDPRGEREDSRRGTECNAMNGSTGATRNRRDVWTIASEPSPIKHFAQFPKKLVEPCILAGCPTGGTVLDPFCGVGTAGLVAVEHGRGFVGIELNPEHAAMAERRIARAMECDQ